MPTVQEILKASGIDDATIAALDSKVTSAFGAVLTTAEQAQQSATTAREAAELATRTQRELYDTQIAPSLDAWANEKAQKEAEIAFYRTQAEQAKAGGFVPKDAPGYVAPDPARAPNGQFVPGPNGSPQFMTPEAGLKAVSNVTWVMSEHQRLHGAPLPDEFETLVNEAVAQRMPFRDYAAKKYNFDARRSEIAQAAKQKELDAYAASKVEENNKQWAERTGGNPMVRVPQQSQFAEIRRGVDAKTVKDPLSMSREERRAATQQMIHKDLADHAAATVN